MEKTNGLNGATKWVIALVTTLIMVGAICQMVRSNTGRLDKVEPKIEAGTNTVMGIKTDIIYIREGIDELKKRD